MTTISEPPRSDRAFVWNWLPGAELPTLCGRLERLEPDGRVGFRYSRGYLEQPGAMPVYLPELPLRAGLIEPMPELSAPGCILDAGPDACHFEHDEPDKLRQRRPRVTQTIELTADVAAALRRRKRREADQQPSRLTHDQQQQRRRRAPTLTQRTEQRLRPPDRHPRVAGQPIPRRADATQHRRLVPRMHRPRHELAIPPVAAGVLHQARHLRHRTHPRHQEIRGPGTDRGRISRRDAPRRRRIEPTPTHDVQRNARPQVRRLPAAEIDRLAAPRIARPARHPTRVQTNPGRRVIDRHETNRRPAGRRRKRRHHAPSHPRAKPNTRERPLDPRVDALPIPRQRGALTRNARLTEVIATRPRLEHRHPHAPLLTRRRRDPIMQRRIARRRRGNMRPKQRERRKRRTSGHTATACLRRPSRLTASNARVTAARGDLPTRIKNEPYGILPPAATQSEQ